MIVWQRSEDEIMRRMSCSHDR